MVDTVNDTTGASSTDLSTGSQLMGRCKWFNNKAGYGFLTVVSNGNSKWDGVDVFVHHSAVTTETEQYKYLVQGEYVSFTLQTMDDGAHEYQANDVRGCGGGKLMCETRNENRKTSSEGGDDDSVDRRSHSNNTRRPQGRRQAQRVAVHVRGTGPREGEEWMLVRSNRKARGGKNTSSNNHKSCLLYTSDAADE